MRDQKVLISTNSGVYDINNKWLPGGVNNFLIEKYTDYSVVGKVNGLDFTSAYEFEFPQFMKLLAHGQKLLAHKGNVIYDSSAFRNNISIPDRYFQRRQPPTPQTCPICLNVCYNRRTTTRCGHHFHMHCITPWIRLGHNTCPVCRQTLTIGM